MSCNPVIKDAQRYKTVLCQTHTATGQCPYTWKCQFAHGVEELRQRLKGSNQSAARKSGRHHSGIPDPADWRKSVADWTSCPAAQPGRDEIVAEKDGRALTTRHPLETAEPCGKGCLECTDAVPQASQGALDASTPSPPAPLVAVKVVKLPLGTHTFATELSRSLRDAPAAALPEASALIARCASMESIVSAGDQLAPPRTERCGPVRYRTMEPPVLQELSSNAVLPLELNHATGKVEISSNCAPMREASANTLLIRRQMSCLLDELSGEASDKRRVQW